MKKLPIGISTFAKIRENECCYIDKTHLIKKLVDHGEYYFLSRPRRFGKSLFVDTLKEIFEGNQKLFKGLYIYDKWDWDQVYPVIVIDFASAVLHSRSDLDHRIRKILKLNQERLIVVIQRLFAAIPWRNFTKNDLPGTEGYYASVLYAFFSSLDAEIIPEDITNHGQVDMTVKLGEHIYVMEIKVVDTDTTDKLGHNPALKQIQEKGYAEKYRNQAGRTVHEVGLVFSRKLRNLLVWGHSVA